MSQPNNNENMDDKRDNLIFDLIQKRLDDEIQRTNNLDTKAGNLVGFVSVLVGLLLGAGSLLSGAEIFKSSALLSNHTFAPIYFVGVAFLLISIGSSLYALKARRWMIIPNVQTLIDDFTVLPYKEVLQRIGGEMADTVSDMENQNNAKAKLIVLSWYLLTVGLCIVFTSIIVFTIIGGMEKAAN